MTGAGAENASGGGHGIQSGDRVPADLRLVRVKNLRIDEASLTGESLPVEKRPEAVDADAALGDRFSMAYSGTLVTYGQGQGVVVATGDGRRLVVPKTAVTLRFTAFAVQMAIGAWWSVLLLALAATRP